MVQYEVHNGIINRFSLKSTGLHYSNAATKELRYND